MHQDFYVLIHLPDVPSIVGDNRAALEIRTKVDILPSGCNPDDAEFLLFQPQAVDPFTQHGVLAPAEELDQRERQCFVQQPD